MIAFSKEQFIQFILHSQKIETWLCNLADQTMLDRMLGIVNIASTDRKRQLTYDCSLTLTQSHRWPTHALSIYGNGSDIYLRNRSKSGIRGSSRTSVTLNQQCHYSTSWSHYRATRQRSCTWIIFYSESTIFLFPSRSQTPSLLSDHKLPAVEIIHGT